MKALVVSAGALNRIVIQNSVTDDWCLSPKPAPGCRLENKDDIVYIFEDTPNIDDRLLIIKCGAAGIASEVPKDYRTESLYRLLRASLAQFRPGFAKIPLDWKVFHYGSLLSFQTTRRNSGVTSRFYLDVSPEGYNHVYMYRLSTKPSEPLDRIEYDTELFDEAVLRYEEVIDSQSDLKIDNTLGPLTVSLEDKFTDTSITYGIPFSTWRDVKLTQRQRDFFDAPFDGPLRVRGPAGTGKTLVLCMRFLREIYEAIDNDKTLRICFLTHGEETAEMIVSYLLQIDERAVIYNPDSYKKIDIEVTTVHGLANRFINRDTENVQPLSLDGSEGRKLQHELIESVVQDFLLSEWAYFKSDCRPEFAAGIDAGPDSRAFKAFCYDLSDEFANVLEVYGVRGLDDIRQKYFKSRPSERALARISGDKRVVLELYRRFRRELLDLGVVSLDQFTADFIAYLNSFRWDALRRENGFDAVFTDELHLFNSQERRVLGFLLREQDPPRRVAVAYDPRQSPRNSFFPEAVEARDTIWSESGLDIAARAFELNDVFRYTPQILHLLNRMNDHFPANDLAEEWSIKFGRSEIIDGPRPTVMEHKSQLKMIEFIVGRIKYLQNKLKSGDHIALLCLDHDRFALYRDAGIFDKFVIVAGRDELGNVERFRKRPILSMPEYVAGLQFSSVILCDANANLISELGGGVNGLHRFISSVYLGSSRAKHLLEIHADLNEGGLADPLKDALLRNIVTTQS